jgi:hypothetical protein
VGADDGGIPVWSWIVGGVGVASLVASGVFLADQLSAGSAIDDRCGSERVSCPLDYDFAGDRSREKRSNILFITFGAVGVVALGAAVIGIATAGSDASSTASGWRVVPFGGPAGAGAVVEAAF